MVDDAFLSQFTTYLRQEAERDVAGAVETFQELVDTVPHENDDYHVTFHPDTSHATTTHVPRLPKLAQGYNEAAADSAEEAIIEEALDRYYHVGGLLDLTVYEDDQGHLYVRESIDNTGNAAVRNTADPDEKEDYLYTVTHIGEAKSLQRGLDDYLEIREEYPIFDQAKMTFDFLREFFYTGHASRSTDDETTNYEVFHDPINADVLLFDVDTFDMQLEDETVLEELEPAEVDTLYNEVLARIDFDADATVFEQLFNLSDLERAEE